MSPTDIPEGGIRQAVGADRFFPQHELGRAQAAAQPVARHHHAGGAPDAPERVQGFFRKQRRAAGLAGAATMALGVTLTRRWGRPPGVSPTAFAGWQLTAGGLFLLPVTFLAEGAPPEIGGRSSTGSATAGSAAVSGGGSAAAAAASACGWAWCSGVSVATGGSTDSTTAGSAGAVTVAAAAAASAAARASGFWLNSTPSAMISAERL